MILNRFLITLLIVCFSCLNAQALTSSTVEIYIAPGKILSEKISNDLSLTNDGFYIVSNNNENISIDNLEQNTNGDHYLTVIYFSNKNILKIYDHGELVAEINLSEYDINVNELFLNIENRYKSGQINFFRKTQRTYTKSQVQDRYKNNYGEVKVAKQPSVSSTNKYRVTSCGTNAINWDGGGSTNNWSEAANWVGDVVPPSTKTACFDSTSNKNALIDTNIAIDGIRILDSYTGSISHNTGVNTTIGADGFNQDGGTFTSTNGNLTIRGSIDHTAGTFVHNGGMVILNGSGTVASISNLGNVNVGRIINSTIFNDQFSGAATELSLHAPNTGSNWSLLISTMSATLRASTNIAERTAAVDSTGALYIANIAGNGDYTYADYDVSAYQVDGDTDDDTNILAARIQTNGDMYVVRWNETNTTGARIFKRVSGVWSSLMTCTGFVIADQSTVTLRVRGNNISFIDDGITVCQATDSSISSPGRAGLGQGTIGITGFTADDLSTQKLDDFTVKYSVEDSGTVTLGSNITVGSLTINSGNTLDVSGSNYSINVNGNWNNSGAFNSGQGTVTFNGSNSTISGNSTFYNLVKSASGTDSLTFEAGKTQTINNSITLQGQNSSNLLTLQSSSLGNQWGISIPQNRSLSNLNVRDSNNINVLVDASTGTINNLGNNTGWCFSSCPAIGNISVSGKVYATNTSTPLNGKTVKVAVNGIPYGTTDDTDSFGEYTINNIFIGAGSIITVFIDDEAENGGTITVSDGNSITNLNIYQNHLIIRNDNSGSTTNSDIRRGNVSDDDVSSLFSVGQSNLVFNNNIKLLIPNGHTYAPGGYTIANDITVYGTLNLASNTLISKGKLNADSGNIISTGNITFAGTGATIKTNSTLNNLNAGGLETLFSDAFTNVNGTELSMHTPTIGNNWEQLISIGSGTLEIRTNRAETLAGTTDDGSLYIANVSGMNEYPYVDYEVSARQINGGIGDDPNYLAVRIQNNGDMYAVKWNETTTNGIRIYKKVANTWTQIMHCTNIAVADASIVVFSVVGNTLEFKDDGVVVCSATDTSITSSGRAGYGVGSLDIPGFIADDSGTQIIDDFSVKMKYASLLTLESNLDINGNLVIGSNSTLSVSPSNFNINLAGIWDNIGGTFTPFEGTVTLDGMSQRINGSNTFYNLSKSISALDTLTFESNKAQTITNNWTAQGVNAANRLRLRSSTTGTRWQINPTKTRTISYVDVADSNNISASKILAGGGTNLNSGNNLRWDFAVASSSTPTVTSVSATNANGTYGIGERIYVTVQFSENVTVMGVPYLSLNAHANSKAHYASGSGTSTLTFHYDVNAGHNSSDLAYTSTTALNANGGSIVSTASNMTANLTLFVPGTEDSLDFNKNIVISTSSGSGTYITSPQNGDTVSNTVTVSGQAPLGAAHIQIIIAETSGTVTSTVSSGSWSLNLPNLAAGSYTITAISLDSSFIPIESSPAVVFNVN